MNITPESLKDMAAHSVAASRKGDSTLNQSITKIASESDLNSEQVKRLVETTNQMAYLSQLENENDRTFEFDVADYDSVMDDMISAPILEKSAGVCVANPMDIVSGVFSPVEKVALENKATLEKWGKPQVDLKKVSKPDKVKALKKVAEHQRVHLDNLVNSEYDSMVKLAQHRAIVCRDPEALEKMAKFDNGAEMAKLVFGHEKFASDVHMVWSDAEMAHVKALSDRLSMVKSASEEIKELRPKVEKAEGIVKEAFMAAALRAATKSTAGKLTKGLAKAAPKAVRQIGKSAPMKGAKRAYGAFDAIDSTKVVSKGTTRNFDAWSSLRG